LEERKRAAVATEDFEAAFALKAQINIIELRSAAGPLELVVEPEPELEPEPEPVEPVETVEPQAPEPEQVAPATVADADQAASRNGALVPAQLVLVFGLVGAAQHNGKRGVVRRFIPEKGRYEVQLADEASKIIAVKRGNLQPSIDYRYRDVVCVRGLVSAAEHNGRKGAVRGLMNERNGRFQIELTATGFTQGALTRKRIWAKPSNLELDVKAAATCKLTAEDRAQADEDSREQEESLRHVRRLQEIRAIQRRNVQEGIGDASGNDERTTEMYRELIDDSGADFTVPVQGAPALARGLALASEQTVPSAVVEVEEECSLCLEPMPVGSSAAALPSCGHVFHHSTVRPNAKWAENAAEDTCCGIENCLELTASCPMCRCKVKL
jgi:hypothetical protein